MTKLSEVTIIGGDAHTEGLIYDENAVVSLKNTGAQSIIPLKVKYPKIGGGIYVGIVGIKDAQIMDNKTNEIVLPCPPYCTEGKYINFDTAKALVES